MTTINSVVARLPKPVLEESSMSDVKGWILDGLRLLPDGVLYAPKIGFFELEDGKMYLPKDVHTVNSVIWQHTDPDESCCNSITENIEQPCYTCDPYEVRTQVCKPLIYFSIFLYSNYYNRCFTTLRYAGKDKSLLTGGCPNLSCNNRPSFVITPDKILYTQSFDCGWLCINYNALLCDESGEVMIPDNQTMFEFLISYVMWKHWEERAMLKEENAVQMYDRYKQEKDILYRKARGNYMLRNVEIDLLIEATKGSYARLLQTSNMNESFR